MPSWIGPWEILILLVMIAMAAVVVTAIVLAARSNRPGPQQPQRFPPGSNGGPDLAPRASPAITCPSCGVSLAVHTAFCYTCGTPLNGADMARERGTTIDGFCRRCGSALERGDRLCHACGTLVPGNATANRGSRE